MPIPTWRRKLKRTLKKYFIPHRANHYHPHVLHTKHAIASSIFFIVLKVLVFLFAISIPAQAFLAPDVLLQQGRELIALTNQMRQENGLAALKDVTPLEHSSYARATDMDTRQYFSHTGPNGHTLEYFLNLAGYDYSEAGENLAMGFSNAPDVMQAWMKSPTHEANLANSVYQEIGIGLVEGTYQGQPTVFVAEHFGLPFHNMDASSTPPTIPHHTLHIPAAPTYPNPSVHQQIALSTPPAPSVPPLAPIHPFQSKPVLMERITSSIFPVQNPIATAQQPLDPYDASRSFVSWQDVNSGNSTKLEIQAVVHGTATQASASVNGYTIPLHRVADSLYQASWTVPEPSDNLFRVIIAPSINLTMEDGSSWQDSIPWQSPKIVSPTPVERYFAANRWLSGSIPIFSIVRGLYLAALIFFSIALALNIFIEIRKQHPHVIMQTGALIALLILCVKF